MMTINQSIHSIESNQQQIHSRIIHDTIMHQPSICVVCPSSIFFTIVVVVVC